MFYFLKKISFLIFCFGYLGLSQVSTHPLVSLKEVDNGKRLELIAVNKDTISYVVFLRVETNNYRKSGNRPVLATLDPNSEKHLLTLIKLKGKEAEYDKTFIVNETVQNVIIQQDKEHFEINFDDALNTKKITLYTTPNCGICVISKDLLAKYKIPFKNYDVDKSKLDLVKLLRKNRLKVDFETTYFLLNVEGTLYTDIKTRQQFVDALNKHVGKQQKR